MNQQTQHYYLPAPSYWPIIASIALLTLASGFVLFLNHFAPGPYVMVAGALILAYLVFGWFGVVIKESVAGLLSRQVDHSFRWGMSLFIYSEVMFFVAFFVALFYARNVAVPWLGDTKLLWPHFVAHWPTVGPGITEASFTPMKAWGIPAINTLILLSSGATVTWAHWGLIKNNRTQLKIGLIFTILLGATFLGLQAHEYAEAGFSIKSGIYGTTFFMLTGFHGLHVTLGAIMLTVILFRVMAGHFSAEHHFGFEAVAWYWHFVDVVWLLLFVFVYWL